MCIHIHNYVLSIPSVYTCLSKYICGSLTNKPVTISGGYIPLMTIIFIVGRLISWPHCISNNDGMQGRERKREGEAEGERYSTLRCNCTVTVVSRGASVPGSSGASFSLFSDSQHSFYVAGGCREETSSRALKSVVMMWFEKVQGGSMRLNYPKPMFKHPAHLASPLEM